MAHLTASLVETILLVIGVSILVVALFQRLRIPAVVGFILTGVLIGPHGLGWVKEAETIQLLAEIGVVLLLFSLGIEFSTERLLQLRHYVLRAGLAQVLGTVALCMFGALLLGYSLAQAVALGMIISLSSTAVGVKLLKQREELDSTHGRMALGVLLLQDVMAPLFMAILPFLAQASALSPMAVAGRIALTMLSMVAVYFVARGLVPLTLRWLMASDAREVPVLGSLFIALLMGFITQRLGLSPALGAFVAGIIISETPYSHQITANIAPFRDSFLALFFISVGLLVNFTHLLNAWWQVLTWTLLLMVLKWAIVVGVAYLSRRPLRVGLIAGAVLLNIGEFSFVLMGQARGLLPDDLLQGLVAGTSLSILLTPLLLAATYRLTLYATGHFEMIERIGQHLHPTLRDHVIIVGYGLNGRNLAHVLRELDVPFVVVELNGALVREAQKQDIPVVYGDAANPEILKAAGIQHARAVVLAMSDPISTRYTVRTARELNPTVYVVARTRYLAEIEPLYAAGATDVIPEEFEAFVEIADRVLQILSVDEEMRQRIIHACRARHYKMLQETREGIFAN
ncbi:Glutathione-regulated potassium-efflux system protein KefC [bacterium HR15]|nr:Glutathione-regulated potassium-efflux system protein KefC [bacterium HR15]